MPYDAIIIGNPTFNTPGKFGSGCLSGLSNADALLTEALVATAPTAPWAFECWYKCQPNAPMPNGFFILVAGMRSGQFAFTNGNFVLDGNWHHFVLSGGPQGSLQFYDGVKFGGSIPLASDVINLGSYLNYIWPGGIDETALWNYQKYTANFTPPTAPYTGLEDGLIALYHFDGGGKNSCVATMDPVVGQPVVATNPTAQTATQGTGVTLLATASGNPTPSVQWQSDHNTEGVTWTDVQGATNINYSYIAQATSQYRAVFSNNVGTAISQPALVTVTVQVGRSQVLVEASFPNILRNSPAVTALAANRIYPLVLDPTNKTFPALDYKIIASTINGTFATRGSGRYRVEVNCWGLSYGDAVSLRSTVVQSLDGYNDGSVSIRQLGTQDFYEHELLQYRAMAEFYIYGNA